MANRLQKRMDNPSWMVEQQRAAMLSDRYDWSSESCKAKKALHQRNFERWVGVFIEKERSGAFGYRSEDGEIDLWRPGRIIELMCHYIVDCANGGMIPSRRGQEKIRYFEMLLWHARKLTYSYRSSTLFLTKDVLYVIHIQNVPEWKTKYCMLVKKMEERAHWASKEYALKRSAIPKTFLGFGEMKLVVRWILKNVPTEMAAQVTDHRATRAPCPPPHRHQARDTCVYR